MAKEAYDSWLSPQYKGIFYPSPFMLVVGKGNKYGCVWVDKCMAHLDDMGLEYETLSDTKTTKDLFPLLAGRKDLPELYGYCNRSAGWADAQKGITLLRDLCIDKGVSFISGAHGTVTGFEKDVSSGRITAAKTKSENNVKGQHFILAAGAWSSALVPMYNSTLATGQVLAYLKLTPAEIERLKSLPIYIDFDSGWFCFPPHEETGFLKCAVHGWGYTRSQTQVGEVSRTLSSPPNAPRSSRQNYAPVDGIERLRAGLREILPELAERKFDRAAVCWYSDTPTGDFIMDYHPDYSNLFLATGGSGQYVFLFPYTLDPEN